MAFWKKKKRQTTAKKKTNAASPKTHSPKAKPVPEWKPTIPSPTYKPPEKGIGSKASKKLPEPKPKTSPKKNDARKEFMDSFRKLTYRHRAWDIWRDFVIMFACSLSNPVDKDHYDEREARYMRIIRKYNKQEQAIFPELAAQTVLALEENQEQDFLGSIFMELNLGNESGGQFFTPYHICELMAEIALSDDVVRQVNEQGYITIHDPCCGAGATLIAGVHAARRKIMGKEMNAHEFMKTMENLINSPNQKLIGDMRGGYVYAVDTDKPELMYAATEISKANRRATEAENRLDALKYAVNDVFGVAELHRKMALEIKKVIFNNPATIVFWADGTKTVVKAENEEFDPEKGLAMAIAKKALGNKGNYFNKIKEWTNRYNEEN